MTVGLAGGVIRFTTRRITHPWSPPHGWWRPVAFRGLIRPHVKWTLAALAYALDTARMTVPRETTRMGKLLPAANLKGFIETGIPPSKEV
jgi:hypothetical protein